MIKKCFFLANSGFYLRTDNNIFIFDYYLDTPNGDARSLNSGVITSEALTCAPVYIFVSHRHYDHFNKVIFEWAKTSPDITYILSDDIPERTVPADINYIRVAPNAEVSLPCGKIKTLKSTDEGVAFIIETDGLKIYHAGDLNWWHWDGEPDEWNNMIAVNYKTEIRKLKNERFDLAFVPVDPRLERTYYFGIDYFMRNIETEKVIPMHFGEDFSIIQKLIKDNCSEPYRKKIVKFSKRGEKII